MSLLKARKNQITLPYTEEMIRANFSDTVGKYVVNPSRENVVEAIGEYAIYSFLYVNEMAQDFRMNTYMKDCLTAMNSILAEMCNEQQIPYYNVKHSYTIIDKVVSYVLDNGEEGLDNFIDTEIDIMINDNKEEEEVQEVAEETTEEE